jgi:hypothetical protein
VNWYNTERRHGKSKYTNKIFSKVCMHWPAIVVSTRDAPDNLRAYFREKAKAASNRSGVHVSTDDLIAKWNSQSGVCALTGLRMTYSRDVTVVPNAHITNASVDRIDPSMTYTRDNIQLVCKAVNYMKHVQHEQTFIWLCKLVVAHTSDRIDMPPKYVSAKLHGVPRSVTGQSRGVAKRDRHRAQIQSVPSVLTDQ